MVKSCVANLELEIHPLRDAFSSSCGGLQPLAATEGPFRPKGDFSGQTDKQPTGGPEG